jgi:uncharacterized protein with HEPN domain
VSADPTRDRLHLQHILECVANVEADVGATTDVIRTNRTVRDAVLRNLQVLAESTQHLSDSIKATQPAIPWPNIAGFRHRLVHDYFRIDLDLVCRVVEDHLPELKRAAEEMLKSL